MLTVILAIGCNDSSNTRTEKYTRDTTTTTKQISDLYASNCVSSPKNRTEDTINFIDSAGLKQGKWVETYKGETIEIKHYKNDTLHGPYIDLNGNIEERYYREGKLDSMSSVYYGDRESLMRIAKYDQGKKLWVGFPASGSQRIIPLKSFYIFVDSLFIQAPYTNGNLWYEGSFYRKPDTTATRDTATVAYGIHRVYYKNGKLKSIINFKNKKLIKYDYQGNILFEADFKDQHIHEIHINPN